MFVLIVLLMLFALAFTFFFCVDINMMRAMDGTAVQWLMPFASILFTIVYWYVIYVFISHPDDFDGVIGQFKKTFHYLNPLNVNETIMKIVQWFKRHKRTVLYTTTALAVIGLFFCIFSDPTPLIDWWISTHTPSNP